jgi:hypothetical protein
VNKGRPHDARRSEEKRAPRAGYPPTRGSGLPAGRGVAASLASRRAWEGTRELASAQEGFLAARPRTRTASCGLHQNQSTPSGSTVPVNRLHAGRGLSSALFDNGSPARRSAPRLGVPSSHPPDESRTSTRSDVVKKCVRRTEVRARCVGQVLPALRDVFVQIPRFVFRRARVAVFLDHSEHASQQTLMLDALDSAPRLAARVSRIYTLMSWLWEKQTRGDYVPERGSD